MLNTLLMNFKIDFFYSMNSYIYNLKKLPIMSDLIKDDAYKYKSIKTIGFIFGLLKDVVSAMVMKIIYFILIIFVAGKLHGNLSSNFLYIYFVLSILGLFINNSTILNTSTKKYFSIMLFKMDALNYTKANLISKSILNTLYNFITFLIFNGKLKYTLLFILIILIFNLSIDMIGEAFNLIYYKKYGYPWYSNLKLYFSMILIFFGIASLCNFGVTISYSFMNLVSWILLFFGIISYLYLISVKDYKYIYKRLNTYERVMNKDNNESYSRSRVVSVNKKDIEIDNRKIKNKHGYDLFNTIFFERHKSILYRSLRMYSFVLIIIFFILLYLVYTKNGFGKELNTLVNNRIGLFALIMYFVNRGAIMTQAMFYNCDHALLNYNFYREEDVLLGLFKRRLISLVKANLVPGIIIGVGVSILLYITGTKSMFLLANYFIYILVLSIFFSIHYLVLYYLLQPYNKDMRITNYYYSIIVGVTYLVVFTLYDLHTSGIILSTSVIIFTIIYSILSLYLVKKYAPKTFRIK